MAETARKSFGDPLVRFLVKFAQSLTAFASYSANFIRNPTREVSMEFMGSFDMTSLLGLKPRTFKFGIQVKGILNFDHVHFF